MKAARLSNKGQIAIPKEIRENLDFKPGDQFRFRISDGKLILEPVVTIPKNQAWFWSAEIQTSIRNAEKQFRAKKAKLYRVPDFIEELKD